MKNREMLYLNYKLLQQREVNTAPIFRPLKFEKIFYETVPVTKSPQQKE